ncbi:hypothetical protein NE865_00871 [Phthorimaea operculella]|nr:hypothetical protein NE865_00871 [Phthorimaea operculella]
MASSSRDEPSHPQDDEKDDINTKMKITRHIVHACTVEGIHGGLYNEISEPLKRTKSYTKCPDYTIYKAKSAVRKDRPFADWDTERKAKNINFHFYDHYRKLYITKLLGRRQIPNIRTFSAYLRSTVGVVKSELRECGFTWVRIPGTNNSMIIEKPEHVNRRFEYLSKLSQYRTEGRNIIYVDERNINVNNLLSEQYDIRQTGYYANYMIVAANRRGPIHMFFYNDLDNTKTFLLEMSQKLKEPSVIVMGEKRHHEKNNCPLPTQFSTKKEMSDFLTRNDVPHEPDMPKAELYSIIQRCKSKCVTEMYSLDQLLSGFGHVVLRRPYGSHALQFFTPFWKKACLRMMPGKGKVSQTTIKKEILDMMRDVSVVEWGKMEDDLIETESRMFTEDLQVEEIIDKIMMMAKDGNLPKNYNSQSLLDEEVDHHLETVIDLSLE